MSAALRIAVVGAGGWGRHHARIVAERPDTTLCAVVGRSPERTAARAAEFGAPAYTELERMLAEQRPDLVFACLPNQGHFETTRRLIDAGVPLLVEKPLVFDLAEADTLIEAAAARGLFFAINFNHRWAEPLVRAKRAVDDGACGAIVFASWRFGGEGGGGHPHANLIETQCHAFDQLEHLCGPIDSVMAQMTDRTGKGFSTHVLALSFRSGAVGSLIGSYDASYAYPETHRLEINGTDGRIVVEDTVRRYRFQRAGDETETVWQAGYFNDRDRAFHRTFDRHVDDLLRAFRAGEPPPVPAEAGRRALRCAHAAIASFETGQRMAV